MGLHSCSPICDPSRYPVLLFAIRRTVRDVAFFDRTVSESCEDSIVDEVRNYHLSFHHRNECCLCHHNMLRSCFCTHLSAKVVDGSIEVSVHDSVSSIVSDVALLEVEVRRNVSVFECWCQSFRQRKS